MLKNHFISTAFALTLFLCSCTTVKIGNIPTVNNNVCKRLTGNVVLYAIFVDTKYSQPWSDYDMMSTLDSIHEATAWIEKQGLENGIPLKIVVQPHRNKKVIPIVNDFPGKTLSATLFTPSPLVGIPRLDRWANKIAKTAGQSFSPDSSLSIKTKNKLDDRERLIARIRDQNKTDNVVLMYFINNYYKEEISVAMHTASMSDIEYAVVSFKNPSVIAHEFLHVFGALDLYISPFDSKRAMRNKKEIAMKEFPDEIMAFAYRRIDSLTISPLTKYLIGWKNELDDKYSQMILGKKMKPLKY